MGKNDGELVFVSIETQPWVVLLLAPQGNYLKSKILKHVTVFAYLHVLNTMDTICLSLIHQWGNTGQLNPFFQTVSQVTYVNS